MKMRTFKTIILGAMLTMTTLSASAQDLKPQVLADNHVMLRVSTDKRFVLLPVEESQDNDHIRVIRDNQVMQELNVRLAVNKVDYYVPFRLGNGFTATVKILNLKPNALALQSGQMQLSIFTKSSA